MTNGQAVKLSNIIREVLGEKDEDTPYAHSSDLRGDLSLDSLDIHDIVVATEDDFNIFIDDDDLVNIKTFGDFKAVVDRAIRDS